MKIIDGKKIAKEILKDLKKKIQKLKYSPTLSLILIGKEFPSKVYFSLIEKKAKKVGVKILKFVFSKKISEERVLKVIERANKNKKINGILIFFPLPKNFNPKKIIQAVSPKKDVDRFHPKNISLLREKDFRILPPFCHAILKMLEIPKRSLKGKKILCLVNSKLFGEVLTYLLNNIKKAKSKYVFCKEINEEKIKKEIKKADILITSCGREKMINGEIVKTKSIILDGGFSKKGKGDVDVESVSKKVSFLSKVPGGVGEVTTAFLLENVYLLTLYQHFFTLNKKILIPKKEKSFFLVLEGLDGSGHTTQANLLKEYLEKKGFSVFLTKEPTDTSSVSQKIKHILSKKIKISPLKLQKLFAKDRQEHLKKEIIPALKKGKIVICDRYFFSSFAYGGAEGVSFEKIFKLNKDFLYPDLTFILNVSPKVCLKRIDERGKPKTLFEKQRKLQKVWRVYQTLPREFEGVRIINGEGTKKEVFFRIKNILLFYL